MLKYIIEAGAGLVFLCSTIAAAAQPAEVFYKSNSITLLVAADVGGGYDVYARALAPYIRRHIEGNPNIVVQNMPGNGGVRMANYLYNDGKKDGSVIGMTLSPVVLSQMMKPAQVRYDAAKFEWLGTVEAQTNVLSAWAATSPVKSIDEAKQRQITIGATTPDSFLYQEPALMNALLGTKFKIVKGYKGVNDLNLALERGEIEGQVSPWSSWKSDKPDWLKQGKLIHLIRTGAPADDLPGVPNFADLVKDERGKALVGLLDMSSLLGRSLASPPGTPRGRVDLLRAAIASATHDVEFVAEMNQRKLPVVTRGGQELQDYVAKSLRIPTSVVREFVNLVTPSEPR